MRLLGLLLSAVVLLIDAMTTHARPTVQVCANVDPKQTIQIAPIQVTNIALDQNGVVMTKPGVFRVPIEVTNESHCATWISLRGTFIGTTGHEWVLPLDSDSPHGFGHSPVGSKLDPSNYVSAWSDHVQYTAVFDIIFDPTAINPADRDSVYQSVVSEGPLNVTKLDVLVDTDRWRQVWP